MGEPAGTWIRVSSGDQDEQNQVPDVMRHVAARGYDITRRYQLHDKSAYKGEQQEKLDAMLADVRSGAIKVLVIWHSDRLERRGGLELLMLLASVRDAGGRVESVKEPELGQLTVGGQVMTFIGGVMANEESKHKSERVTIAFDTIDANNAIRNKAVYGYRITGGKYHKKLEIVEAEAAVIREAAARYLSGQSLARVAEHMNAEGHRGRNGVPWSVKTLSQVLRKETLIGRRRQGGHVVKVPAILEVRTWRAVQSRLDAKAYRKGTRTRTDTAMLTSVLHCGYCGRPMYKLGSGNGGSRKDTYYCRPRGGQSCKLMVPVATADAMVTADLTVPGSDVTVTREVVVKGTNHQDEIDQLQLDYRDLDMTAPDFLERVTALKAETDRLASLPAETDRIETQEVNLSELVSEWQEMTPRQRRQVLLDAGVRFYARKLEDGSLSLFPWTVTVAS